MYVAALVLGSASLGVVAVARLEPQLPRQANGLPPDEVRSEGAALR